MTQRIFLKISTLFFISSSCLAALPVSSDKNTTLSAAIGYTQFPDSHDQLLVISDYVTDLLTHGRQRHNMSYNFSVKQQLEHNFSAVNKIMFGPALYWQKAQFFGDVWEMVSPEFFNYRYDFASRNISVLLESDFYFNPIAKLMPFVSAGAGFGVAYTSYNDHAFPNIPSNSELHWSQSKTKASVALGAGFSVPISDHWAANLRYTYLYMGKADALLTPFQPISIHLNSQNVLLGINYSL